MLFERKWGTAGELITLEESKIVASRCVISDYQINLDEGLFLNGNRVARLENIQGRHIKEDWYDIYNISLTDISANLPFTIIRDSILYIPTGELFTRINEG